MGLTNICELTFLRRTILKHYSGVSEIFFFCNGMSIKYISKNYLLTNLRNIYYILMFVVKNIKNS